jgi:hypothetical protein
VLQSAQTLFFIFTAETAFKKIFGVRMEFNFASVTNRDAWLLRQEMSTEELQSIIRKVHEKDVWNAIVVSFSPDRLVNLMKNVPLMHAVLCFLHDQKYCITGPGPRHYTHPMQIFAEEAIRLMDDTHIPILNRLCFDFVASVSSIQARNYNTYDIEFICRGIR